MNKYWAAFLISVFFYIGCTTLESTTSSLEDIANNSDVSYNAHVKRIISNNCLTCHSGKHPTANLQLEGYENLITAIKERGLLNRINNREHPMPTDGLMSKNERLAIQKWTENNFALDSKNNPTTSSPQNIEYIFTPPSLTAVDIDKEGFEFFEQIQGHWIGSMFLLGQDMPWFAFDFRAIDSSQVHGLFEGGSMGNLFNTFFIAEYKGVKTIMLRNGGILSGIYRTSYFVLTDVSNGEYFFEDAYGGKEIMYVMVSFKNNEMTLLAHTSKLGSKRASKHVEFKGKRIHNDLAANAAKQLGYPSKKVVKSFPNGMPTANWGSEYPLVTSASYIMQTKTTTDYVQLGKLANDPIQLADYKNVATLKLSLTRNDLSKGESVSVYFSRLPLTKADGTMESEYGYISEESMNTVVLFPEIHKDESAFTFYYLHPGKYYITCVVDKDGDYIPSSGDVYSSSTLIEIGPGGTKELEISDVLRTL